MIEFKLPALGADMDEATLLEWNVQPGDVIMSGTPSGVGPMLPGGNWFAATIW